MKNLRKAMQAAEHRAVAESPPGDRHANRSMPPALRKVLAGFQALFILTTWGGLVGLGLWHQQIPAVTPAPPTVTFSAMPLFASLRFDPAPGETATPAQDLAFEVLFEPGSDLLTPTAEQHLAEIAVLLKTTTASQRDFRITGHADASGTEPENLALSHRRAERVHRFLVEHADLPAERLLIAGYGESHLRDRENPESAINRRVEIATIDRAL